MVLQWEWYKWSFDLKSPWSLAFMDPYFGLFSSMSLWDMCELFWVWWSMHGGCEWSIRDRSLLISEANILCDPQDDDSESLWPKQDDNKKKKLIYHQLNHHLLIKIHIDEHLILTWFHTHSSSEMLYDWRIELYGNLSLKNNSDIFIKFYLFWILMIHC